ncbi:MAG: bifunctional phosphoribosyl-AMP cyclohydrolase/phosphoribosyl-ATP diphosphatase HisIE [Epsilonproteobacteria bacterium]|nr:bifunctional phosphoribosyl-AMP cyclohydrolase/phosphoribosyl-ATP pyrophosphatase [Campylobacterota bacterium]NPA56797.1 bifunctional phosphoribosyl-AMP cyclohydrolase/phosphoribosyl-ATP diphosphatase HisIE [Campylobacterota bacterium]
MEFQIDWEKNPLIPVIVQEGESGEVLMLAYMNREAFQKTVESGYAHYYSRSRQKLWKKGERSGNTQKVLSMALDCDSDALLLKVEQKGAACHTGQRSCFHKDLERGEIVGEQIDDPKELYGDDIVDLLYHTILERKERGDPTESWTAKLFQKGENAILKKVAEEAAEFSLAVKDRERKEIIHEGADLLYHALVALALVEISPELIRNELRSRFGMSGIREKAERSAQ